MTIFLKRLQQACIAVLLVGGGMARAQTDVGAAEELSVTPYRPTVSSPAALPAPGRIEFESGYERRDESEGGTRDALGYLFKYAFNQNVGVLFGGEAWARHSAAAQTVSGGGDSFITLKLRLPGSDSKKAFGFELTDSIPTAKSGLGAEKSDLTLNTIGSFDLSDELHADVNVRYTRLGQIDQGGRGQWGWAAATSYALNGGLGVAAELSGTARSGETSQTEALIALTWSWCRKVVLDAAFAHRLSDAGDKQRFLTGISMLF